MNKLRIRGWLWQGLAVAAFAGCGGKPKATGTPTPPEGAPLSGLVSQQMLITPVQRVRVAPELNWTGVPAAAALLTALDSGIVGVLHARDPLRSWVFGEALMASFKRNPGYAADPRSLAVGGLNAKLGAIPIGTRLTEPLASQVRTMIALQEARLVLIPVDFRIEVVTAAVAPAPATGRAVVRLVLVDPRASEVKWISEVKGDPAPMYSPAMVAGLASKVANLFIAP